MTAGKDLQESERVSLSRGSPTERAAGWGETSSADSALSFGPFVMLRSRRLLLKGGAPVKISIRAFDLLCLLVDRAGTPVLKKELLAHAWRDVFVHEASLKVYISMLRRILAEGASSSSFIATVAGGYQFVARVTPAPTPASESADTHAPQAPADVQARTNVIALPARGLRPTVSQPDHSDAAGSKQRPGTANNLPIATHNLIGRASALAHLRALCADYRVVTLAGPGGIGKTSLAVELARGLLPAFDGGVWLVELASIIDPNLVPVAVAEAMGLRTDGRPLSAERIARLLGQGRALIILDNCEHVIDTAALFAETILRLTTKAVVLATSRETLRTQGECVYRVPPLDVPNDDADQAAAILRNSAVQLFLDRADALQITDAREERNLRIIANICRRLDGIPLAIEFAAARVSSMGFSQVQHGLSDRFGLLSTGRRTALPRHQTLRAVLDWSYGLLPEAERALLRRLAVFPGTFDHTAVRAVMRDCSPEELTQSMTNLVDKSLVVIDRSALPERWRLLDTVRAYGQERLTECTERAEACRTHAEHFLRFFADFQGDSRHGDRALTHALREADNLRAALFWAFSDSGDEKLGVALVVTAVPFWLAASLLDDCCQWTAKALEASTAANDDAKEMVLRSGLGQSLLYTEGMTAATEANLTRALALAETLGDAAHQRQALHGLWQISLRSVKLHTALQLSRRYESAVGDDQSAAGKHTAKLMLGMSLTYLADYAEATSLLERAVLDYPPIQRRRDMAWLGMDSSSSAFGHLSTCLLAQGRIKEAVQAAERSIEEARQLGQPVALCLALTRPAALLFPEIGDFDTADRHIGAILELADRHVLRIFQALAVCAQGRMRLLRGDSAGGIAALRIGLGQFAATGYRSLQTIFRGYFAEALAAGGQVSEGLREITAALDFAETSHYLRFVPELLCILGRLLAQHQPDDPGVERIFQRGIDLSRQQGALYWELCATLGLAEFWCSQGRRRQAHELLAPVTLRFAKELDMPVLARARTRLRMLDNLAC